MLCPVVICLASRTCLLLLGCLVACMDWGGGRRFSWRLLLPKAQKGATFVAERVCYCCRLVEEKKKEKEEVLIMIK